MKRVILKDLFGEFCTARNHPGNLQLRDELDKNIENGEHVIIDRSGIKMLSVSFLDDLIPPLILKHSKDQVQKLIQFTPPLEEIYLEQIERGVRLRSKH